MGSSESDKNLEQKETVDYEKLSYDPYTYRRVQKIRAKGLQHGVTVPKLNFQLTKPERSRKPLIVMGIMSSVVFVTIIGLMIALYVVAVKTNGAFNVGEVFVNMFNPTKIVGTLGLSILGGIGILLYYLILIVLLALPIILIYYMYRFVRAMFALSTASKEEFAKGHRVKKYISLFLILGISSIALFVASMMANWPPKSKAILGVILIMFAALMLGYAIILIKEKTNESKWFDDLDEERKRDYIEHDHALAKSKNRAEMNSGIDTGFWR